MVSKHKIDYVYFADTHGDMDLEKVYELVQSLPDNKNIQKFICDVNKKYLAKVKKHPMNKKKLCIYECDASKEHEVKELFTELIAPFFFQA